MKLDGKIVGDGFVTNLEFVEMPVHPDSEGRDHLLVTVANYWGHGKTVDEAFGQIKRVRGRKVRKTEAQVWLACGPDTRLDDMGCTSYPSEGPRPVEIFTRREGRAKSAVELDRRSEFAVSN